MISYEVSLGISLVGVLLIANSLSLREIVQSVDRMKIARGIALWILLATAIGVITALVLGVRPPI